MVFGRERAFKISYFMGEGTLKFPGRVVEYEKGQNIR